MAKYVSRIYSSEDLRLTACSNLIRANRITLHKPVIKLTP
jgi:hypothetical protein